MHLVKVSDKELLKFHRSRLVAAAVVLAFFSAVVAFAPDIDPNAIAAAAVASAPQH